MDIGLYQFKHKFRSYLEKFLPHLERVDPNWITLLLLPIALLTAWTYRCAAESHSLYLVGILLIGLRMVVSTLDGMCAEHYGKTTPLGTLLNRLCPEFADISLMLGLILSAGDNMDLAIWAMAIGWASAYLGIIGLAIGRPILSLGPVGQTDRLVALVIASLLAFVMGPEIGLQLFFWWCIFGGLVTCALRLQRLIQNPNDTPGT
jgi:phosphatidylglycerophosphate synthase